MSVELTDVTRNVDKPVFPVVQAKVAYMVRLRVNFSLAYVVVKMPDSRAQPLIWLQL